MAAVPISGRISDITEFAAGTLIRMPLEKSIQSTQWNDDLLEIALKKLLGREPASWDRRLIRERVAGQSVMVTGAAGSIGSELCREILLLGPRALMAVDQAETPLFLLGRELAAAHPKAEVDLELGSVTCPADVSRWMKQYRPSIVYHAAAYKHVSMMERNVFLAVENNIFGTWNMALAAAEYGVKQFILISTDKAVRPASVMGATKRAAELLIHSMRSEGGTKLAAVRFGNVLGSSGSVAPIFKQQIAAGGPVTVTHHEMRRYFMTGAEAAQLVLQASALSLGGETFILDLGDAVRIMDLAKRMIEMSVQKTGRAIDIVFTGIEPGEKLIEELHLETEHPAPTAHPRIRAIHAFQAGNAERVEAWVQKLHEPFAARDAAELICLLKELVPEYKPSLLHAARHTISTE